jgi:hypothetical protein
MEATRKPGVGIEKRLRFKCGICQTQLRYPPIIQFKTLQHPTLANVMNNFPDLYTCTYFKFPSA